MLIYNASTNEVLQLLYPILSPDTENKAGKYFGYCIEEPASPEANDVATSKK